MAHEVNTQAIIKALGAPPRQYPEAMTRNAPRAAGKLGPSIFVGLFGGLALGVAALDSLMGLETLDSGEFRGVVAAGLVLVGVSGWLLRMRARIIATCRDVLVNGRAVVGQVASLKIVRVGGADAADHYEFAFVDGGGQSRVLKAFWNAPPLRLEPGSSVVVLHDPADPLRATVYPLDYPDLKLNVPATPGPGPGQGDGPGDSAVEMMAALERLGVPLDFGQTTPMAALMGGVIKAGLFQGIRKLEAGKLDEAIESFDAVLQTAERDAAFTKVQAVIYEQRGLAFERKGDRSRARADYEASLRLDPGRAGALAGRDRL